MITQDELNQIVDAVERIVMNRAEELRQEFYGAIQQLISNQQALAEMLAQHNNPDVVTALGHEFWRRAVVMEAERINTLLTDPWEALKPTDQPDEPVQADPELQRLLDEEEEIERRAAEQRAAEANIDRAIITRPNKCPYCGSNDPNKHYKILRQGQTMPCDARWHDG